MGTTASAREARRRKGQHPSCLDLPDSQCKGAAVLVHVQTQAGSAGCKSELLRYKEDALVVLRTQAWGTKSRPRRRRRKI